MSNYDSNKKWPINLRHFDQCFCKRTPKPNKFLCSYFLISFRTFKPIAFVSLDGTFDTFYQPLYIIKLYYPELKTRRMSLVLPIGPVYKQERNKCLYMLFPHENIGTKHVVKGPNFASNANNHFRVVQWLGHMIKR